MKTVKNQILDIDEILNTINWIIRSKPEEKQQELIKKWVPDLKEEINNLEKMLEK